MLKDGEIVQKGPAEQTETANSNQMQIDDGDSDDGKICDVSKFK